MDKAEKVFEKLAKKNVLRHAWETVSGAKATKANKLLDNQRARDVVTSARRARNEDVLHDPDAGMAARLFNKAIHYIQGQARENKRLQTRVPKLKRLADRAEKSQYIAQGTAGGAAALTGAGILTD